MDSVCSETDFGETSQGDTTVEASVVDAETFLSVESQVDSINDVSTSFVEIEDDQTQYTSQINSVLEEDSANFETTIDVDVSASIEATAIASKLDSQMEIEVNENTIGDDQNYADESSYFSCKIFELGRYLWKTETNKQCYTKGCIWSPDGTCCLVPVHLDGMHLVELPTDLYDGKVSSKRPISKLTTAVHVKEGGTVYDCAWYPFMNSTAPETCCWLASRQHEPIHMWDAFNGDLRATYRGYDDVDEIEAAISVSFSCDGLQVIGGYKKYIRIFNTDAPGRDSIKIPTKQAVSCFALTPHNENMITSGSWNGVINLYDQRSPNIGSLSTLCGHTGGITLLRYSNSGEMLFSGARKDNTICFWDMRNFSQPLASLNRNVSTNQRIFFDLSPQNDWLISGDTTGSMGVWNLKDIEEKRSFRLHDDSCNGVSFHPSKPIIASSSGQYHFVNPEEDTNVEETVVNYENALVFWWIEPREC